MMIDSSTPTGLRRAALALHAMQGADRDWLLQQLSETEKTSLRALLAELSSLGMPMQSRFVDEAVAGLSVGHLDASSVTTPSEQRVADAGASTAARTHASGATKLKNVTGVTSELNAANAGWVVDVLEHAQADVMASVLGAVPPLLVARVLVMHRWPWSAALLDACTPMRRRRIEELQAALGPMPPAFAAALGALLLERVDALRHGRAVAERNTSFKSRLQQRCSAWFKDSESASAAQFFGSGRA